MTLPEWVALAMLWWKGGGRPAIVRWLVEPGRMVEGSHATLETVAAAIDPGFAASGRLTKARVAAEVALEAARVAGITAVPWSDTRYPTRWPRSLTRLRSCGSAAIRTRSGHRRLRSLVHVPAPPMLARSAGSWDPVWRTAASQW